jgi:hypothetical protein
MRLIRGSCQLKIPRPGSICKGKDGGCGPLHSFWQLTIVTGALPYKMYAGTDPFRNNIVYGIARRYGSQNARTPALHRAGYFPVADNR